MIDWRHWHNEPYLVGGLILLGWLYAVFTGPLRGWLAPAEPYPRRQAWYFYSALFLFYLTVGSPLDQIAERFLLSVHMLQHQLLIYPCAALFLLGLPAWLVRPVTAARPLRGLLWFFTRPLVCGLIYILTYSLWHAPGLYEATLQNKMIHVGEHLMFFGGALFYWWPALSPSREFPPISHPGQMLYQTFVVIGMTPAFAYITFADRVLYPTYAYAPRLIANFTPAEDQLLAGILMKIIGMGVALLVFGWSFFNWYRETGGAGGPKKERAAARSEKNSL
ncbi:MAG TPA: cytochrome c oxidase assembly protein [Opitutaceae bacterium]|nr:cytochrome c oxidase assembly protein [Opitutaceae bacterium]